MSLQLLKPTLYPFTKDKEPRFYKQGVYEFCGPQRSGKTTLEVWFLLNIILKDCPDKFRRVHPEDVWTNFPIDYKGINCTDSEGIEWCFYHAKKENWKHKVFVLGEASQKLYARNYKDMEQTSLVSQIWQFPKMDKLFLYESNPNNSVDKIIRDGTTFSFPTAYEFDKLPRDEQKVRFDVIANYQIFKNKKLYLHYPAWTQQFFDSYAPVN